MGKAAYYTAIVQAPVLTRWSIQMALASSSGELVAPGSHQPR